MSLDLAMTVRRLPHQALAELRAWIVSTLSRSLGTHRPGVPLFRGIPTGGDGASLYLRRMLTWLATRPAHWLKGIIFGVFTWLIMMAVFMPLAKVGFFGSRIGPMAAVVTLIYHLAYGAVLGTTYGLLSAWVPVKEPEGSHQT